MGEQPEISVKNPSVELAPFFLEMVVWDGFFMFFWFFFCLLLDLGKGVRIEEKKRDFEGFGEGERMWDEEEKEQISRKINMCARVDDATDATCSLEFWRCAVHVSLCLCGQLL